jgi:hypothetical protein
MPRFGSLFVESRNGLYQTTTANIITAYKWFREHPQGIVVTGMWEQPRWTYTEFHQWFLRRLHTKINRVPVGSNLDPHISWRKMHPAYQRDLAHDARFINDYASGIRHTGCHNILNLPEMQKKYPNVNTQPRED